MKKVLNGKNIRLSIKNQHPVVLVYTFTCPVLILIFYIIITFII